MPTRLSRWLLALLVCLPATALAGLPELTPVVARYRATVNGIPAGTAATVEVKALAGNRREVTFHVRNRFLRNEEVSRFDWQGCRARSLEYAHEFEGLGIERASLLTFDWERRVAIERGNRGDVELPLADDAVDALNMAMQARCRLRDGQSQISFPVVYHGKVRPMELTVTGRERVETPLGTFDSVLVERRYPNARFRRTRVWVAPALDWFMVRFEHVENPAARGSLLLTHFLLDGKPVAVESPAREETP